MFEILRRIWRTGQVTKQLPLDQAPSRYRGKPVFVSNQADINQCLSCRKCMTVCPSNAIRLVSQSGSSETLELSYAQCVFCGECGKACDQDLIQITNEYRLATVDKSQLVSRLETMKSVSSGKEE